MFGSQLLEVNPDFFKVVESPYNGEKVVVVPALQPDWAILHVQEADEQGNARILGSKFQDVLMSRAAKKTIVTTEKLVSSESLREENGLRTDIPHFLVAAVAVVPGGALPGRCWPLYGVDDGGMKRYLQAVRSGRDAVQEYLRAGEE